MWKGLSKLRAPRDWLVARSRPWRPSVILRQLALRAVARPAVVQLQSTKYDGVPRAAIVGPCWYSCMPIEAVEQLAFADRVLLNKVDLVTAEEIAEVEEGGPGEKRAGGGLEARGKSRTCVSSLPQLASLQAGRPKVPSCPPRARGREAPSDNTATSHWARRERKIAEAVRVFASAHLGRGRAAYPHDQRDSADQALPEFGGALECRGGRGGGRHRVPRRACVTGAKTGSHARPRAAGIAQAK